MADTHTIAGRQTTIGDGVHYVDGDGTRHAATIRKIIPPESNGSGSHTAHLHVYHQDELSDIPMRDIQHSVSGFPNTWTHKPNI